MIQRLPPEDREAIQRNNWRAKEIRRVLKGEVTGKPDNYVDDLLEDILSDNYEVLDETMPTHRDHDALPNPKAPSPPEPRVTHTSSTPKGIVGIFVGHNRNTGARGIEGQDEWETRNRVAKLAQDKLAAMGYEAHVLYRDQSLGYTSAMRKHGETARKLKLDVSMELHFNAYDGTARGAEILVWSKRTADTLGEAFQDVQSEMYPDQPFRGIKIMTEGRGAGFNRFQPCPSGVYEPFFGDHSEWFHYNDPDEADKEAEFVTRIFDRFFQLRSK